MTGKKQTEVVNKTGGGAYILAMIGAAVYYVSIVDGFWNIVIALLKALVWPAFFVHDVLQFIA